MRLSVSITCLAFSATLASAAMFKLPILYSCEPAIIPVLAKGNYTIESRDSNSNELVFRAHVKKKVNSVTWDSVELPADASVIVTVIDQLSIAGNQTAIATASATVQPNPTGNTTCLLQAQRERKDNDKGGATKAQKNMVPTIVGIVLGAFFLLVVLLVGAMMYRRKKEKAQKVEDDSLDLNHGYGGQGNVPAGGSYMARLVPGLVMQDARPLPRDPVLESEQANYSSTRRGTHYYKNETGPDVTNGSSFELPNYGQSQRFSKAGASQQQQSNNNNNVNGFCRRDGMPADQSASPYAAHQSNAQQRQQQYQYQQQAGYQPYGQQHNANANANPFASQKDLSYEQPNPHQVYEQKEWGHSQASFLTKKSSH